LKIDLNLVAAELLAAQELIPRARRIAHAVAEAIPGSFVNLYTAASVNGEEVWTMRAWAGGESLRSPHVSATEGTVGEATGRQAPVVFPGSQLSREDYAHLDVRRTLRSLAYLPLIHRDSLAGLVEILTFDEVVSPAELQVLLPLAQLGAAALTSAFSYEAERNDSLASVMRLTQLYDLERSFSSTLEMDELLPMIGAKFREAAAGR
jgi:hypothetical protein